MHPYSCSFSECSLSGLPREWLEIVFLKRDGVEVGGEREISCLLHTHQPEIKPETWVCAPTMNQTLHLRVYRTTLQPLSNTGQGESGLNFNYCPS